MKYCMRGVDEINCCLEFVLINFIVLFRRQYRVLRKTPLPFPSMKRLVDKLVSYSNPSTGAKTGASRNVQFSDLITRFVTGL